METWREFADKMREVSGDDTVYEIVISKSDWLTLADRIETACKTLEDENKKLNDVLRPILDCKWKILASKHGTEVGDDPEFDQLCDLIWMAQRKMIGVTE